MIVTSGSTPSLKKFDSATLNTILMRTDGFKSVFKGLTNKNSTPGSHISSGNYTSIGKRTPAKQYNLTKDSESRFYTQLDKSGQYRRTQTAQVNKRRQQPQTREKQFERGQQEQSQYFAKMLTKLGI